MRKILLLVLFIIAAEFLFAQGYKIDVELPNAANREVKLAYHYLDKIYARDTVLLNQKGMGTFQGDTLLPQGLYKILIDESRHFDLLIGSDQEFYLYNNGLDASKIKIEGSKESEAFVDYLVFLRNLQAQSRALNQQLKSATTNEQKEEIRAQQVRLNDEMTAYRDKINREFPGSLLYKFMVANEVPTLDISTLPAEVRQNDSLLLIARFNYQREHYWDYFDYTDERMLYTPFYKSKLDTWFNKVLYPAYDSVKPYVYSFLEEVESNPRIFQVATSFFVNASINSNVLGMDALFVDLANDYYLSGKAFWATEESLDKIRENVLFLKDNLIGKTGPELMLESYDGEYVSLHQIDAEITVVLIYEPDCGHCKVFVPEFYNKVYRKYKEKGLEVYAIYSMENKQDWTDFLVKHDLWDWINVWDKDHTSRFKILYDGRKTPGVYVLDRDKTIIAKRLDVEQLDALMKERLE